MNAFFPGKFQPPHLGHVLTIMGIYNEYDKIIIGVTDDTPRVLEQKVVRNVFEKVFQHLPKIEVAVIEGVLCLRPSREGLPEFDVLLTGNPDVVTWAKNHEVPSRFIHRSEGLGFSGTMIREAMD